METILRERIKVKMLGRHVSPKTEFKKGHPKPENAHSFDIGKNHPNWKGNKVGYHALHSWVYRTLGRPSTCQGCGKTGLYRHKIHWANKSKNYLRDVNDWIRLCVSCHKILDNRK